MLTESKAPKQYIKRMRSRDAELNFKWGTICTPVQMVAADGKKRAIQAATIQGLLRIIQSIPSKRAEPFKAWLAQVGRERIEETIAPELAIDRALESETGQTIITSQDAAQLNALVVGMIEDTAAIPDGPGSENPSKT